MKTVIIDYGMGNLRSIKKKLEIVGIKALISSNIDDINSADKLIMPGVGHFAKGMTNLKGSGLLSVLNNNVLKRKKPILGICLGMQLFSQFSEEGNEKGLGWLRSDVRKFDFRDEQKKLRIPHVGWNTINILRESILLQNIDKKARFYFSHSYFMDSKSKDHIVASTDYGGKFDSIVEDGNIYGVQFHPEKSRFSGLQLIKNFIDLS